MSKILINENNTLKVCELPAFMTLGETTKIKDVPGIKELLSIPCSEGEYQLVDDTVIFYKDGDKYFIYNMEDNSKKELDISKAKGNEFEVQIVDDKTIIFEKENHNKVKAIVVKDELEIFEPRQGEKIEILEFNGRLYFVEKVKDDIVGAYDVKEKRYIPAYPGNTLEFTETLNCITEWSNNECVTIFSIKNGVKISPRRFDSHFVIKKLEGKKYIIEEVKNADEEIEYISFYDPVNDVYFSSSSNNILDFYSYDDTSYIFEISKDKGDIYKVYEVISHTFLPKILNKSFFEVVPLDDFHFIVEKEENSEKIVSLYCTGDLLDKQIVAGTKNWLTYRKKTDSVVIKDHYGVIKKKIIF